MMSSREVLTIEGPFCDYCSSVLPTRGVGTREAHLTVPSELIDDKLVGHAQLNVELAEEGILDVAGRE
jgi:hypothetical protein